MPDPSVQVVFTNKARCRDCYRCVRVCPVKAIRMHEGQANVEAARCISCGTCVRECPQAAKSYRHDGALASQLVRSGVRVACSLAPSFAAAYPPWQQRRLPSALRRLGFSYVGETAIGAWHTACATAECLGRSMHPQIGTACPAVVRFVELYRPQWVPRLTPVVSPMIAHARHLRQSSGSDLKIVFIGPCLAKKAEIERPELLGLVDCALTFVELNEWLEREGIDLAGCEESDFDETPLGSARLFPLAGGCVKTAGWSANLLDARNAVASGFDELCDALDALSGPTEIRFLEALFCAQGCVHGPAMPGGESGFARRDRVLDFARRNAETEPAAPSRLNLATRYAPSSGKDERPVSAEQIRRILEQTGKSSEADQLNCGACGYSSCRDKAVAVIRGMAEPEMCMPYVRRLAEQRVDRIIETSPNGIVVVDAQLQVLSMNPAFRKMFMCSDSICGRPLSYLMDPEPFERLAASGAALIETTGEHTKYGIVCHQILYPLREERQYVGIFVNITHHQDSQKQLDQLRAQTILQARELLDQQLSMAEAIASALGENTARSEALLDKLRELAEGESGNRTAEGTRRGSWLTDTYTSK